MKIHGSKTVNIELTDAEALVFFEWLASFLERDADNYLFHEGELDVLNNMESSLEKIISDVLSPDYQLLLDAARLKLSSHNSND